MSRVLGEIVRGRRTLAPLHRPAVPVLARTMSAPVPPMAPAGTANVSIGMMRQLADAVRQAWADIQTDFMQLAFVTLEARADIPRWIAVHDTKLTELLNNLPPGTADPDAFTVTAAEATAGNTALGSRYKVAVMPLLNARAKLNKAFRDAAGAATSGDGSSGEGSSSAGEKEAKPAPTFTYVYDTHGDKHFGGSDAQWEIGKQNALTKMVDAIRAQEASLPAIVSAYGRKYKVIPGRAIPLYYTERDPKPVGRLDSYTSAPKTSTWTIQLEVDLDRSIITYHGYPDDLGVKLGLKLTKKG